MLRSLRKVASGFLAGLMLLSASAMAENVPNDVPLQQIAAEAGADNYYQEAIETEIYNYKLVRNLPTTFTQDTWETYCSLANGLMDLDAENLADVQKKMVDDAVAAREALVQSQPLEESIWYIWGEDIATIEENPSSLEFTVDSYDNADFVPFLTPYLLENQEEAKGNLIIIAGGGYSERNNSGEGWPIASALASWDSTAMCSSAVWRPTLLKTSGWTCSVRFAISGIMRKTTAWVEWIAWRLWDSRAAV